ncbi:MAG: response regulator [Leptolyngbya sp. SIO4C5]|nr:response regulator [Leptolyngbya sp. SIO4C5]
MSDYRNTVLLIDDDAVSRTYMRLMLQKVEYSVIEAKDGIEGLELYQRLSPALVLLDAKMPGMSGFECCRKIRNLDEGKYVPILMVTGLDDQSSTDDW